MPKETLAKKSEKFKRRKVISSKSSFSKKMKNNDWHFFFFEVFWSIIHIFCLDYILLPLFRWSQLWQKLNGQFYFGLYGKVFGTKQIHRIWNGKLKSPDKFLPKTQLVTSKLTAIGPDLDKVSKLLTKCLKMCLNYGENALIQLPN